MAKKKTKYRYRNRYKKKRRRRRDNRVPLLTTIPVAWKLLVEPIMGVSGRSSGALAFIKQGKPEVAIQEALGVISENFTGHNFYRGTVNYAAPMQTYTAIILGWLGSKIATKMGANRAIKKIPMIGKYIKL